MMLYLRYVVVSSHLRLSISHQSWFPFSNLHLPHLGPLLHHTSYLKQETRVSGHKRRIDSLLSQVDDILNLINTRDGDYAAACSMDYAKPPAYYDTFALRDIEGYEAVTSTFPYFRSKISRDAMIAGQPVPVQSCWNGMGMPPFPSPSPLTSPPQFPFPPPPTPKSSFLSSYLHPTNSILLRRPLLPLLPLLSTPHLPRHPRQPRGTPPRGLRMLPHPHRQPAHALQRRLAQPRSSSRVFSVCIHCCAYR